MARARGRRRGARRPDRRRARSATAIARVRRRAEPRAAVADVGRRSPRRRRSARLRGAARDPVSTPTCSAARRTGDETYVSNLLRELPSRRARPAVRRRDAAPRPRPGRGRADRAARAAARSCGWPGRCRACCAGCGPSSPTSSTRSRSAGAARAVVTLHDLSFERDADAMGSADRVDFKTVVPRAARRPTTCSPSRSGRSATRRALRRRPEKVIGDAERRRPRVLARRQRLRGDYLLFVGAIQRAQGPARRARRGARGRPAARRRRAREGAGARARAARGRRRPARLRAQAELAELYRGAAALVLPSRFEGFGLPVLEAMASGTPVVAADEPALREVAGDAGVYAEDGDFAAASGARSPSASGSSPPGSSGRSFLVGRDGRGARSTSTGRCWPVKVVRRRRLARARGRARASRCRRSSRRSTSWS